MILTKNVKHCHCNFIFLTCSSRLSDVSLSRDKRSTIIGKEKGEGFSIFVKYYFLLINSL